MKIWQLNKAADRKIRSKHPWIFSSDLAHSPKGVEPGELIELRDCRDQFFAFGYGHPNSLISFRKLSQDANERDLLTPGFFLRRLTQAAELRRRLGFTASHRLCFAEADGLPGLIIDSFRVSDQTILVVQSSTAGIDRALEPLIETLSDEAMGARGVILSNTSSARRLEGLEVQPRRLVRGEWPSDLSDTPITVASNENALEIKVDLLAGQKTGFFLDQGANTQRAAQLLSSLFADRKKVSVLDLCCYVGQWSAQLALHAHINKQKLFATLVDSSAGALNKALLNVQALGAHAEAITADVLTGLTHLGQDAYDIVVCDPPAFIKRKKDLAVGRSAYVKLNRDALKKVAQRGLFISCSCSASLPEGDFEQVLLLAAAKSERKIHWIWRGGQSPDHPVLLEFPEGRYLKCWMGIVE